MDREELVSTGLGMGVAVPHAKVSILSDFFIAIAVLKKGVDWGALDKAAVRLVVMIGGPANRPGDYLQILSRITLTLKAEELRKKILQLTDAQEIIDLLAKGI
ncbi:MAG: PTS sugar transporter subunit IIA [Chlamydiae bacterium]|nr:PTS sugar transporter subunit IIA [Chlamydiota bacterium]